MNQQLSPRPTLWIVLELAWTIGYTIAVPLVIFTLIGRWLDRRYDTSPAFLLSGIVFSLVVTTVALAKKMGELQRMITAIDEQKASDQSLNDHS